MNNELYHFFTRDHRKIEDLLEKATENRDEIAMTYYNSFRIGLLTHIRMEEKILFPAAQKANGGEPLPITSQLRLDHGAITALLTLPPNRSVIKVLWHILGVHDQREEAPGGMYDLCEALTQNQTQSLLETLGNIAEVPVHPPNPSTFVLGAAKRAVARAGYDFEEIAG